MNLNPKIYKINKNYRLLKDLKDTVEICKFIINCGRKNSEVNFKLKDEDFSYQNDLENNLKYFLYTFNSNEIESDWKNYFPQYLIKNSNFIRIHPSNHIFSKLTQATIFVSNKCSYGQKRIYALSS